MNLSMINQARELKKKMEETQEELKNTIIKADAGNGTVKVTVNGQQQIQAIEISTKIIDPDNTAKLEELVMKAVSDALDKSQKLAAKRMGKLTGGLKIPGLT